VRINFKTGGGIADFPGLGKPIVIDCDKLPEAETRRLEELLGAVSFFSLPSEANRPARGAADYQHYTITVEDGERQHTVQLVDPVQDPDLQKLIAYLRQKTKEIRAAQRRNT
jgi:hypothetical protein